MHDAKHVVAKARRAARTRRTQQTKTVAAAPEYLRARVAREAPLPEVSVVGNDRELLAVVGHTLRRAGQDEGLPDDLFAVLMEMMVPAWHSEWSRP